MAIDNWAIRQTIDLARSGNGPKVWPDALLVVGDRKAHTWEVTVTNQGQKANLAGAKVTGYFNRADNVCVPVQGTISGNVATVTLDAMCYAIPGPMVGIFRIVESNGVTYTASVQRFVVEAGPFDAIVDPGNVIPSLDDLLDQIEKMEKATSAANSAASAANSAATSANNAASAANTAASKANTATDAANKAATAANTAASNADAKATAAQTAANAANTAASAANTAASNADAKAKAADTAASAANTAASTANTAASNADAKAKAAETAATAANNAASTANTAAGKADDAATTADRAASAANAAAARVDAAIEEATAASAAARKSASVASSAADDAYKQAKAAGDAADAANDAAEDARAASKKLENIEVHVQVLPPDADATGRVEQTEDTTSFFLGVPQLPVRNATLHMDDEARQVLQRTPTDAEIVTSWRVDPVTTMLYRRIHGY